MMQIILDLQELKDNAKPRIDVFGKQTRQGDFISSHPPVLVLEFSGSFMTSAISDSQCSVVKWRKWSLIDRGGKAMAFMQPWS